MPHWSNWTKQRWKSIWTHFPVPPHSRHNHFHYFLVQLHVVSVRKYKHIFGWYLKVYNWAVWRTCFFFTKIFFPWTQNSILKLSWCRIKKSVLDSNLQKDTSYRWSNVHSPILHGRISSLSSHKSTGKEWFYLDGQGKKTDLRKWKSKDNLNFTLIAAGVHPTSSVGGGNTRKLKS